MAIIPMVFKPKGVGKTKKALNGLGASAKGLLASFGPLIVGMVTVQKAAEGIKKSLEMSGEVDGVKKSFISLGKTFEPVKKQINGLSVEVEAFSDKSLGKYKKAIGGTMSELELMKQANNAMLLGVVKSDDEFAELAQVAQVLAEAVGQDAAYGIESLTTGMGRQSKLMLDNLGIMVDTQNSYDVYAEKIGKTSSQLSEQEKKLAFNEMALSKAKELAEKAGGSQETMAKKMQRASATMQDMGVKLGTMLEPLVNKFLDIFSVVAVHISNFITWLSSFMGKVDWAKTFSFDNMFEMFVERFILLRDIFQIVWNNLGLIMRTAFEKFQQYVIPFLQNLLGKMWDLFLRFGEYFLQPLADGITLFWNYTQKAFLLGIDSIQNAFERFSLFLKQKMEVVGVKISNSFATVMNKVVDKINGMIGGINKGLKALGLDPLNEIGKLATTNLDDVEKKHTEQTKKLLKEQKEQRDAISAPYDAEIEKFTEKVTGSDLFNLFKVDPNEVEENVGDVLGLIQDRIKESADKLIIMKQENEEENGSPLPGIITPTDLETQKENAQSWVQTMQNLTTEQKDTLTASNKLFKDNLATAAEQFPKLKKFKKNYALAELAITGPKSIQNAYESGMAVPAPAPIPQIAAVAQATIATAALAARVQQIKKAAIGYSGQVSSPTMFLAGERGAENVNITPLNAPNIAGPKQTNNNPINISFEGNVLSQEFIEDNAIPLIRDAVRRGELLND